MKPTFESIKKRDGRIVPFDQGKITQAIWEAAQAVGGKDRRRAEALATEVVRALGRSYEPGGVPSVEHVQDVVEKVLIEAGHARTAKAYILYREQHKNIREASRLLRDITIVDDYLDEMDWRVRENSNMTYSLQGLNVHITQKVISNYWLSSIYPREVREAHESGAFHIHDLGTLGPYCVGWDLQDLLREGFRGVKGKVESRPARHFDVALMQVVNFLYTLQGEAAGAQAFSSFDTLLAPFVAYDNLSYEQVRHYVQKFLYNMNVPTRVGFQTPFTNITMDLVPPGNLAGEPVIIGGELQERTYGEFQREMDMINRAFAETMCAGDANGRPFTFPIPTYNITREFQWDNPNLEPLWEMTAKYGIPYFSNFINSDLKPDDVRSMCCRLRLDNRTLAKRGGGLFGANPLTGSIGVVTLNLPRYAFEAASPEEFFEIIGAHMDIARDSLSIKRKVLEQFTERGLYPYSMFYLRGVKERSGAYWRNHFSTIGVVGMNDALLNLIGKDITTEEGVALAVRTLDFMRDRMLAYQEEGDEIYNLEATPAEGTSYRLARIDARRNPGIRIYNQTLNGRAARDTLLHQQHAAARRAHRRHLRGAAPAGRAADALHRRDRAARVPRRADAVDRRDQAARALDRRELPPALLHADADFLHLPEPRLRDGRAGNLPDLRRDLRGLVALGRVPAAGGPVERGQAGGVQGPHDLRPAGAGGRRGGGRGAGRGARCGCRGAPGRARARLRRPRREVVFRGWQKTSLIEFPGRIATVLFVGGCNLRCPWCYNPDLALGRAGEGGIEEAQVLAHLEGSRKLYQAVVVTGGEPCSSPGLEGFLRKVRELGLLAGLETNGTHPGVLARLLEQRLLDYVAVDIKAPPDAELYGRVTGAAMPDVVERVSASLRLLAAAETAGRHRSRAAHDGRARAARP